MHKNIPVIVFFSSLPVDQRGCDITVCLCDRQADCVRGWALSVLVGFCVCEWNIEQKSLNVKDRRATLHLATILSPIPGQFTKSERFSVVCEAGKWKKGVGGQRIDRETMERGSNIKQAFVCHST